MVTRFGHRFGRFGQLALAGAASLVGLALLPGGAAGSTPLGSNFVPPSNCAVGTFIQSASPAQPSYAAPAPGVITAWSFQAGETAPVLKLKVARLLGGEQLQIVGESSIESPTAASLSTFPTRIPVQQGDVLGVAILAEGECGRVLTEGFTVAVVEGDAPVGSTPTAAGAFDGMIDVAAQLEPDADADGFGDETQDSCPGDAAVQGECPRPDTKIKKGPAKRAEGSVAKFRFKSTIPGSTFECKLKGRGLKKPLRKYKACRSPRKYKNLEPGKFRFFVRATSPAGAFEAQPAKYKFRLLG